MGPTVVVMIEPELEKAPQVTFAGHEHEVKELSAGRTDLQRHLR